MSERDCSHCRNHTDDGCKKWKCEYVPNDLIKRQDAIDAICTWDKFGVDERCRLVRWHEGLGPYVHLRDVVVAIENLPSAQCWIPCSERLPEKDTFVLCYIRCESFDYMKVLWRDDYSGDWADGDNFHHKVIAWMPLPEPWKGEKG